MSKVRTRFAPSPTGSLHIGGLRTALYSYVLAKHSNGDFLLRIEDTDKKREVKGSKEEIKNILKLFELNWDEYYVQSERVKRGIYEKAAKELVSKGKAFYCQCQAKNVKEEGFSKELRDPCRDKKLTSGAIKIKVPDKGEISFGDFVLDKEISWDLSTIADTTLLKSNGFPTYHLAVVVDDLDMKITHVLRGHDWLPSTPVHLLIYKYLGHEVPGIGHLTDILDPEGGKLSKRKGSVSINALLKEGYLPEAVLNFIMLLGWAPKDNQEIYSLEEYVKEFDPKGFQKSNPVFNRKKLDWFNGVYMRKLDNKDLVEKIFQFLDKQHAKDLIEKTIPLVKERIDKLADYWSLAGFFFEERKADEKLFGKNKLEHLKEAYKVLEGIKVWKKESLDQEFLKVVKQNNFKTGDFFMDLSKILLRGSKKFFK